MKPTVPWSVKGVEPDAREAAKRAARSAGMTLGAWLNQKILESEDADGGASSATRAGSRDIRASEPPSAGPGADFRAGRAPNAERGEPRPSAELGAVSQSIEALRRHLQNADDRAERTFEQVSRSLEAMLSRLDAVSTRRRTELHEDAGEDMRAIRSALSDVNQRLSAVETRPNPAYDIAGIERSVNDIGRALDSVDTRTAKRIDTMETAMDRLADRAEQRDGRRMDAIRGLERAVTELMHRVDDVSRRQADAARDADRAVADLRHELAHRDDGVSPALDLLRERIFELSEQLETNRASAAKATSDEKLTQFERRIAEALENTAKAEDLARLETRVTETAQATVASAIRAVREDLREELTARMDAAESRSATAIKQLQSDIIEHLEGEAAEPTAAPAGHNGADFSELESKIAERFEQMSAQLDFLARDIDTRIDEIGTEARNEIESLRQQIDGGEGTGAPSVSYYDAPPAEPEAGAEPDTFPLARSRPEPEAPSDSAVAGAPSALPEPEAEPPAASSSFSDTRDQLRRAAARPAEPVARPSARGEKRQGVRTSVAFFVIAMLLLSAALIGYSGWRLWSAGQLDSARDVLPGSQSHAEPEPEPAVSEPRTEAPQGEPETDGRVALPESTLRAESGSAAEESSAPQPSEEPEPQPRAETRPAEDQSASASARDVPTVPAVPAPAPQPSAAQLYAEALDLLEVGSASADEAAAARLEQAAEMGLTIAQFRLATLYETGRGVDQDSAAALEWYTRAAEGGNARAMHNLAVLYAEGSGTGTPDYAEAARWFAEAASYDIRDSQFNLAVLFERGMGVRTDINQAYLWYSIAALSGDGEAANRRAILEGRIEEGVRARIDTAVANWEPRPLDPEANGRLSISRPLGASPLEIARAQELLGAIGYAPGPADGVMGPNTADAIRDFERSAGLPVTGRVTADLISRLESEAAARGSGG